MEIVKEFKSGTLSLGVNDIGATTASDLTGATIDENGVIISTSEDGGKPVAIGEIVWLIALLANQTILIHNLKHQDAPKALLTEEMVELLTSPLDLADYKIAITEALYKGTKRNIESEPDPKNEVVE